MTQKLFEVFLGTFNAEPWIQQVINSLEAQDCAAFNVKIIDNASTDNTVSLIEEIFSKSTMKNSYVLLRNSRNIGPISSFLDRLDHFDSDWIVMIHQDDIYHPDHISTLTKAITDSGEGTGVIFTAMKRIDGQGNVKISPPTLSSKLSTTDRLENFMLSLQISPINFPACALKKSELLKTDTARHTTAFNDIEMLLRMMCVSDVIYVPKETMHYRVYAGNAASITSSLANDRAILVGLVELFHSSEINQVLDLVSTPSQWNKLINSINQAIQVRIASIDIQNLARNLIAEALTRRIGYQNSAITNFLVSSLSDLGLSKESEIAQNLLQDSSFQVNSLSPVDGGENFKAVLPKLDREPLASKLVGLIPLTVRERIFDSVFGGRVMGSVSRPFVKVWRLRGK